MDSNGQEKTEPRQTTYLQPSTTKRRWMPPRGIRLITRTDRITNRFMVSWLVDGKPRFKSFQTIPDQLAFAKDLAGKVAAIGVDAYRLDESEAREWRAFKSLIAPATLADVHACYVRFGDRLRTTITVREAVDRFLELRLTQRLSRDSVSHSKLHLRRFEAVFTATPLADVTAEAVRKWLAGLTDPETGAPMESYTRIHHLRTAKLFFKTAVAEKWTPDNPVAAVKLEKDEPDDVTVLSLQDAVKLFAANADALCIGRLALEAFGGLRFTSASRLRREDLKQAERGIILPGSKHKSGKRHYVDGYPENLWAWIQHATDACWDIQPRAYLDLKAEAFARAGVTNPGNVLRHSFCSYHIAVHKQADRTAVLLTHRSPSMLYQHYMGRATEADGQAYFSIQPPA